MLGRKYIIDSIENEVVSCQDENKKIVYLLRKDLPEEIYEGCLLIWENDTYKILEEETKQRKEKMQSLFDSLKKK